MNIQLNKLALNMIVSENDIDFCKRALNSIDAENYFDEIVLVFSYNDFENKDSTSRLLDKVKQFEKKYSANCIVIPWLTKEYPYGNFERARNIALNNTNSEYVFWMDCDDIIPEGSKTKESFNVIKNFVSKSDIKQFRMLYKVNYQEETKQFADIIFRERIFKNDKSIRWELPVHEQLTFPKDCKHVCFNDGTGKNNICLEHRDDKDRNKSISRNKQIINYEIRQKDKKCHPVLRYYYAIENLNEIRNKNEKNISKESLKLKEDSLQILKNCLSQRNYFSNTILSGIAFTIAKELLYNGIGRQNTLITKDLKRHKLAETYANISIGLNDIHAEPLIMLGDIYVYKNNLGKAEELYKEAIKKKPFSVYPQLVQFYHELPLNRLMYMKMNQGKLEESLVLCKELINSYPQIISYKKRFLDLMLQIVSSSGYGNEFVNLLSKKLRLSVNKIDKVIENKDI